MWYCVVMGYEKYRKIEVLENALKYLFFSIFYSLHINHTVKTTKLLKKQEGHDGPVSLHWLILGNLFKT